MDQRKQGGVRLEDGGLVTLVILVLLAVAWLVAPFFGLILWGLIASIL